MQELFWLGGGIAILGVLMMLAGGIWGIVAAFKEGGLWGLLMLAGFFTGFQIIAWCLFAIKHFDSSYPSFLLYIGGFLPLAVGGCMMFFEALQLALAAS